VAGCAATGAAIAALLAWYVHVNLAKAEEASPAANSGEAEALDPATWSRVRELRERLRLSDGTLAAMECTQETAEGVLTRLLAWYEANSSQWATRRRGTAAARKALRLAVRRLNVGLPEGAERPDIPQLKAALAAAAEAEGELLGTAPGGHGAAPSSLRANVETVLSESQRALWATIRANPSGAGDFAYAPNVTKAQLTSLASARTKAARRRAAARSSAGNSTALSQGGSAGGVGDIFTSTQQAAVAAAKANIHRHMPGVLAASRKILPRPPEPEEDLDLLAAEQASE